MNTEHALPDMGDSRGDHYKSSDEANACGWLRQLFVREDGDALLVGQGVPREWLRSGQRCGLQRAATWFGTASISYSAAPNEVSALLEGPRRNPPKEIRLRFREPNSRPIKSVVVDGKAWSDFSADWVRLPGDISKAAVTARFEEAK
jgi:hypothetical protein